MAVFNLLMLSKVKGYKEQTCQFQIQDGYNKSQRPHDEDVYYAVQEAKSSDAH